MDLKEFGDYFAELRKNEGYKSQRDLADKSGVSNATISRIEAGLNRVTPDVLRELANCFVTVSYNELLQRAGYERLESVVAESQEVYELNNKLKGKYEEFLDLTKYSPIYIKKKNFLAFLDKKKLDIDSVFANFKKITQGEDGYNRYLIGKESIDLEDAIRISRGYRANFSELFFISNDKFGDENKVVTVENQIDDLIKKDIWESEFRRKQDRESEDQKRKLEEMKEQFEKLQRHTFFWNCNDEELQYLQQQLFLYRGLRLKQGNESD